VWTCSTKDAQEIEALYSPPSDVKVIPNTLDASSYSGVREGREGDGEDPVLLFIGAFGYPPNRRAAHLLLDEIFPEVRRQHPNSRLRLVGGSPSEYMREWGDEQAVTVTGFVDDVRPHLAASDIAVIPLMEGSGTRLKIIEAFASKLPVVSTPKGVEGLDVEHGKHALIGDAPGAIASHVSRLVEQPTLRSEMVEEAYELMKQSYSWQSVQDTITRAMRTCVHRHSSWG
jgi:glycosyltransferase involved in cell wall biosynthesis